MKKCALIAAALLLAPLTQLNAGIVVTAIGPVSPPATVGGFAMTEFPADGTGIFVDESSLPTPIGGALGFSPALNHRVIGDGWATWSNGYTGDVYYTNGATSVTITLPAGVNAFDLYAEPNPFAVYTMSLTDQNGGVTSQEVDGSAGAAGWTLYGTGGDTITSVTISAEVDFAVGEFGISGSAAVPEPAGLTLLGLGLASFGGITWFKKRKA